LRLTLAAALSVQTGWIPDMLFGERGQAQALELFGYCMIKPCESDEPDESNDFIDPRFYDAELTFPPSTPDAIAEAVRSASEIWRGRENAAAGSAGLLTRAKGDYRRILAALYDSGHYGGQISIMLNGREAANVPVGLDLPDRSNIAISVVPGSDYLFGRTAIINRAPPNFNRKDEVTSPESIGFAKGQIARAGVVHQAAGLSIEEWRQQGYPTAAVGSTTAIANHPNNQLNVSINLNPGPKAVFGELVVSGTEDMDPEFVRYMAGIPVGAEYDPDAIKKARKRLDRLGLFSTRKIVEAESVSSNGVLPLSLIVKERKRHRYGVGATLSTADGAGVEAYWLHRNLFGKAEQLRLDAKFGGIQATSGPNQVDDYLGATFTKPGVLNPDTNLSATAFIKRDYNDIYEETGYGILANLINYRSDEITLTGGAFFEAGRFEDVFGIRDFKTAGINGDILYDTRRNKLDSKSGIYARMNAKPYYEWRYSNPGIRLEAEARSYLAIDRKKRSILAGRVKVGSLIGGSIAETAPSFLFTAGGGSSVRGFSNKSIGISNGLGQTAGGKSLLETSVEFRQRLAGKFGGVLFVDGGIVGPDSVLDFSQTMSFGAGVGILYHTGVGPIRVEVAVPLNNTAGQSSFVLYAGIGQAF
jgi:translocation and assembly module TamA